MAIKLEQISRSRMLHVTLSTLEGLREATGVKDLPVTGASVFLHVALRGETPQGDLVEATKSSKPAVSRYLGLLGPQGCGLLDVEEDLADQYRRKLVRLSAKGKGLLDTILTTLNKGAEAYESISERNKEDMAD